MNEADKWQTGQRRFALLMYPPPFAALRGRPTKPTHHLLLAVKNDHDHDTNGNDQQAVRQTYRSGYEKTLHHWPDVVHAIVARRARHDNRPFDLNQILLPKRMMRINYVGLNCFG